MDRLMKLIRIYCPESITLLNGSTFTIQRRMDDDKDTSIRMRFIIGKGVFAEPAESNDKLPPQIVSMNNFHGGTRLLELNSLLRAVPINIISFLLTLRNDEPRRLIGEDFENTMARRAFGDMGDIITRFGYASNFTASITAKEVKGEIQ